ncbi:hypothetical protein SLEP1_g48660 [Rubroshorea leprosula]|uniref:Uncharacterized protein n=1 Tax=Rubroshorea leprosula TaxID=152421 RepID=A0AAV5LUC3_9ROSI|nr:hypothetical protein SLEP1_g48660 [Rubroshorea leprosula]
MKERKVLLLLLGLVDEGEEALFGAATLFGEEAAVVQWPTRKLGREGMEEAADGGG